MATDLNTASLRELQRLPGIGEVIAQRIVDARPFSSLVQLQQRVQGIGPKRYLALVSDGLVTIGSAHNDGDCTDETQIRQDLRNNTPGNTRRVAPTKRADRKADAAVDINTATVRQLLTLHGVGPKLAQRIVDARPFRCKEEVTSVRGIGLVTYEKMQHQLAEIRARSFGDDEEEASDSDDEKESEPQAASPTRGPVNSLHPHQSSVSSLASTASTAPLSRCRRLCSLNNVPSRNLLGDIREVVLPSASSKLLIASWNIRNLSKRRDAEPLHRIAEILGQFDVVAIQEVRDTIVLRRLKHFMPGWDYIASPLLGAEENGFSQWRRRAEHFVYFYRRRVVAPVGAGRLGADLSGSSSRMVRPPYIATFQTIDARTTSVQFTLVNVHIVCGDNASRQREMNQLWRLTTRLESEESSTRGNILVLGDFNLSPQDMEGMGHGDCKFEPLILSPLSTTVGDKLLDNIWLNGNDDWGNVEMESGVYRIDWAFHPRSRGVPRQYETTLTRIEAQSARVLCTVELSDHCPVWIAIA